VALLRLDLPRRRTRGPSAARAGGWRCSFQKPTVTFAFPGDAKAADYDSVAIPTAIPRSPAESLSTLLSAIDDESGVSRNMTIACAILKIWLDGSRPAFLITSLSAQAGEFSARVRQFPSRRAAPAITPAQYREADEDDGIVPNRRDEGPVLPPLILFKREGEEGREGQTTTRRKIGEMSERTAPRSSLNCSRSPAPSSASRSCRGIACDAPRLEIGRTARKFSRWRNSDA